MEQKVIHVAAERLNASVVITVCGKSVKVKATNLYPGTEANCVDCKEAN